MSYFCMFDWSGKMEISQRILKSCVSGNPGSSTVIKTIFSRQVSLTVRSAIGGRNCDQNPISPSDSASH